MNSVSHRLLRRSAAAAVTMLMLGSCTIDSDLTRPSGLVTANPPLIFSGAGDISTCSNNSDEATAKLLDGIPGTVFTLGDNVMPNGSTSEFANCYDPTWGRHKARTHPAAGNHDYGTEGAAGYFAYFGAAAGEPGKGYYSYGLGAWHIVVLNSNISTVAGSAQDTWLKADLAAHPNQCTLAYYHHPLYSSYGGSGSGGATYSGVRNLVKDLYAARADLVLNGHRHFYERIAPMTPEGTADPALGIRGFIVGTGGDGGGTLTNLFPLSEVRNGDTRGVLKLYLYDDGYAWKFVPVAGKTFTDSGSTACHFVGGGGDGVSATNSTVSAAPGSFIAGSGFSTITVTARDANGSTISDAGVTLTAPGSGNTLTPASGATDGGGVFTSTFTSTVAGSKTIAATINGTAITQTALVTVSPSEGGGDGLIEHTLLTAGSSGTNQKVYTTSPVSPAPNALVTIAVRSRRGGGPVTPTVTGGGMASWTQVASVDYDAVATPLARLVVFRAMSPTPTSGPIIISYASSVSNAEWVVSQWTGVDQTGTNGAGAIGQTGSANGNVVSSLSKLLAPFGNTGNVALGVLGAATNGPSAGPGAGFTEIAEPSSGESTLLATEWGTNLNTVTATLGKSVNAGLLAIELVAGAASGPGVSASRSTASATSPITAGGPASLITVTVNDGDGNPLSGIAVTLSASGSNTLIQPTNPTDADGKATGTLSATVAGPRTVTAVAGGVTLDQQPVVTVSAGPVSATASSLSAVPSSVVAGSGTSLVTVTVRDAFGNPIGGSAVSVSAPGTNVSLGTPVGYTSPSGVLTSTLSSTDPQELTVTAMADGVAIAQTASVSVTSQPPAAAIAHALLTSGHDVNNLRVYNTASIAPAANTLVTVAVLTHQSASAAPSPTLTGGGMTSWAVVGAVAFNGGTPLDRLTVYRAMSAAPGGGPITITSSVTVSNCQWIVSQWSGVDDSGVNGAGAIVQTGQASGTAVNGLTTTLTPFGSANHAAYGVFGVASATAVVSAGSGFTSIDQQPSGEGTTGDLFAEWALNLNTIAASWMGKSGAALGVEIKAKQGL